MLNPVGRSAAPSHEDVFLARYTALVIVALKVTDGDRQEAEDLVHEAFIRFTLVQPPLDEVQHLDAYLSRMLPNMYTRCSRRAAVPAASRRTSTSSSGPARTREEWQGRVAYQRG